MSSGIAGKYLNLIPYVGGKYYLLDDIYKRLDYSKKSFVDLFGGSGNVIINLPREYDVMIYNDKYDKLTDLFLEIKMNFKRFKYEVDLPYSRKLFYKIKDDDDLKSPESMYYLYNTGFSGKDQSFSYSFVNNAAVKYSNKNDKLDLIYERLKNIMILNYDYTEILTSIKDDKAKEIMIFVDPPYYNTEYYYEGDFTADDHKRLAELLNHLSSKGASIMITYYEFDIIKELYPVDKWFYTPIDVPKHAIGFTKTYKSVKERIRATELIITNYIINKGLF